MSFMIRAVKEEEVIETSRIYIECFREDYHFIPTRYREQMDCETEAMECREWLHGQDPSNALLAAFDGDRMAGYVAVTSGHDEQGTGVGEVCGLFVRKAYRFRGLGARLLLAGMKHLRSRGCVAFVLCSFCASDSNPLYRRLRGEIISRETQEVGGKELVVDVFRWKIDDLAQALTGGSGGTSHEA